jgi:hypothetical protein
MRRIILAGLALVLLHTSTTAQIPAVGIFTDATGTDCNVITGDPGIIEIYVVVKSPVGLSAIEFMATPPGCFNATYLGETSAFTTIGDSQTGISIALGGCYPTSAHVLTLNYFINGSTPSCCVYPILPAPGNGDILLVDCDLEIVAAETIESTINGDMTCFCGYNPAPAVPDNPEPNHNEVAVNVFVPLSWEATDPQDDPLTFDVYFGTAPDPPLVASGLTTPTYIPDITPFATKFYWKVAVQDDKGNEVFGPEWIFTTAVSSAAQLVAPTVLNYCGPATTDTVLVDIQVINSDFPIDTGGFDLSYDNVYLTYVGYVPGDLTQGWQNFSCSDLGLVVRVDGSDPTAIPVGSDGTFVQLMFLSNCCSIDSATTISTLCPENTTDDLRTLWPVCGGFQCDVFDENGDVNEDGTVTPGDALCAFYGYLSFPDPPDNDCGTAGWDVRGDVDCNESITPGDALCIFHSWLNGSCAFCGSGPLASAIKPQSASVSVRDVTRAGNDYFVILEIAGIRELDAFGFDLRFSDGALDAAFVFPAALTTNFDELALKKRSDAFARVGAYSASPVVVTEVSAFVEMQLTVSPGTSGRTVTIDGFVDDLAGASAVTIDLGDTENELPRITKYALYQNHPNPFNPNTEIRYEIPDDASVGRVTLSIFNVEGSRVRHLVDKDQGGGLYRARWNGRNDDGETVSSGVYFYVLRAAGQSITRKMVLLR